MKRYIKLYEEFREDLEITLQREIDVTFRFLLWRGVKSETLQRKIKEKFIESIKPPFTYSDITFYSFDMDHISDIPLKSNKIQSEYGVKAKLVFENVELDEIGINEMIKRGISNFLKLEEDEYFENEVEKSKIVSIDFL
jgi:hypothetical protein